MGGDMLVACLVIPEGKKPDWAAGEAEIKRLAKLPRKAWPPEFLERHMQEDVDETLEGQERDEMIVTLSSDFNDARLAFDGKLRSATWLDVGGKRVLLSGGISWGDSPTEMYDTFDRLNDSGVAKAIGFE